MKEVNYSLHVRGETWSSWQRHICQMNDSGKLQIVTLCRWMSAGVCRWSPMTAIRHVHMCSDVDQDSSSWQVVTVVHRCWCAGVEHADSFVDY